MGLGTIGRTGIRVTPVAMGCWPIAGITSIDVSEKESLETLHAAFDAGINFFDTSMLVIPAIRNPQSNESRAGKEGTADARR